MRGLPQQSVTFSVFCSLWNMKNPKIAIIVVTFFLLVFTIAGRLEAPLRLMLFFFSIAHLFLGWMVYTVLRYGRYSGRELGHNEEWGYQDRPDLHSVKSE